MRYREEDVALAERAAGRGRACRCGAGGSVRGPTPCWPGWAGCRRVSLLSVREGGFPNYHLPADTPERVDCGCLEACVEASIAIARAHAA